MGNKASSVERKNPSDPEFCTHGMYRTNRETQLNSAINWIELTSMDVFVTQQQILKLTGAFTKENCIWDHKVAYTLSVLSLS